MLVLLILVELLTLLFKLFIIKKKSNNTDMLFLKK